MLKNPIMIGLAAFKVADREGKITFFDRFGLALTAYPHNASGGRAHVLPLSTAERILVDPAQEGFWCTCQFGQGLRIDFSWHDAPDLHVGGVQGQGILNLNPLRHKIGLFFPLNHDGPLTSSGGNGDADQYDGKHQSQVGNPARILEVVPQPHSPSWAAPPRPDHR